MKLSKIKYIHLIGIGGVGMVGIAELLLNQGYKISGSDLSESKNTLRLKKLGATVKIGHTKENIKKADVVVFSSAVNKTNPEIMEAKKQGITLIPRAEMLASIMRGFQSIAVAGSHGKTTTTSLIAHIFTEAELDPTYIIGGRILGMEDKSILGSSDYIVVEADESDASFLHLNPEISVLTNIDNDHLDFYENNPKKISDTFLKFLEKLPFFGVGIICTDDPKSKKLYQKLSRRKISFGFERTSDFSIKNYKQTKSHQEFILKDNIKKFEFDIKLKIPGKHNALNATAAFIVAQQAGIQTNVIKNSLKNFSGVSRRFEEKGTVQINGKEVLVVDDYGHHPTEIKSTIQAAKSKYKGKPINMIFQPHRYSRSSILFKEFISVLSDTDSVQLMDIYSAGEANTSGISSYDFVDSLLRKNIDAKYAKNLNQIRKNLNESIKKDSILIIQGAGNVSDITASLMAIGKK